MKKHAYSRNCGCLKCFAEWTRRSVPIKGNDSNHAVNDETVVSSHRMDRITAVVCADGSASLCGVSYGNTPEGTEIIGNGTLPHPLNVRILPGYRVVKCAVLSNEWTAAYYGVQHLRTSNNKLWGTVTDNGGSATAYIRIEALKARHSPKRFADAAQARAWVENELPLYMPLID